MIGKRNVFVTKFGGMLHHFDDRRFQREQARLPDQLRAIEPSPVPYLVSFSACLDRDLDRIRSEFSRGT